MYTTSEWQQFVDNLKRHVHTMSPEDMDYEMMKRVYIKAKNQEPIQQMIRDYGETYFRELIESV